MRAEHPPGRVGAGVAGEGPDEDVDQQGGAVVGQVAEQDRVDERDPDPDDPQQRHPHRDRDPVAVFAIGAEGEEDRERCGEDQHHVEGGAEMGGDDQRRDRQVGGDPDRAHRRRHRQELAHAEQPDRDHREREGDARRRS